MVSPVTFRVNELTVSLNVKMSSPLSTSMVKASSRGLTMSSVNSLTVTGVVTVVTSFMLLSCTV